MDSYRWRFCYDWRELLECLYPRPVDDRLYTAVRAAVCNLLRAWTPDETVRRVVRRLADYGNHGITEDEQAMLADVVGQARDAEWATIHAIQCEMGVDPESLRELMDSDGGLPAAKRRLLRESEERTRENERRVEAYDLVYTADWIYHTSNETFAQYENGRTVEFCQAVSNFLVTERMETTAAGQTATTHERRVRRRLHLAHPEMNELIREGRPRRLRRLLTPEERRQFREAVRQRDELEDMFRRDFEARFRAIILDTFEDPFDLPVIRPKWAGAAVRQMATEMRNTGDFYRMPDLARLLREGKCVDREILDHCDQRGHTRGCWLLRMLTRTEGAGTS
jgi:hypothetical protein